MDVAKDIQLLRRTGPYQLALLSRLRRDDLILPVMKAVWQHCLHSSCPHGMEKKKDITHVHWRPVAESLLSEALESTQQVHWEPMLSQLRANELRTLSMPGSAAVMQIILPQLQNKDVLRDQAFIQGLKEQASRLAAVAQRCMPKELWEALKAVGKSMGSENRIGLFGNDVITEIAARACANGQEWPGNEVFEAVRCHLEILILLLMRQVSQRPALDGVENQMYDLPSVQETEESLAVTALLPAVAAVLFLPISQQVASLQTQFPAPASSWFDYLAPLLEPFPVAGTWKTVRDGGVQAALRLHASDLDKRFCSGVNSDDEPVQDIEIQTWHCFQLNAISR